MSLRLQAPSCRVGGAHPQSPAHGVYTSRHQTTRQPPVRRQAASRSPARVRTANTVAETSATRGMAAMGSACVSQARGCRAVQCEMKFARPVVQPPRSLLPHPVLSMGTKRQHCWLVGATRARERGTWQERGHHARGGPALAEVEVCRTGQGTEVFWCPGGPLCGLAESPLVGQRGMWRRVARRRPFDLT